MPDGSARRLSAYLLGIGMRVRGNRIIRGDEKTFALCIQVRVHSRVGCRNHSFIMAGSKRIGQSHCHKDNTAQCCQTMLSEGVP